MAIPAELRKTAADTGYAVVGATDIAVERVRQAQARAAAMRGDIEVRRVSDRVQQVPTTAVAKGLEAAGKVEETYGELSARGKKLVQRIRAQRATQDLLAQSRVAVSRTKGAVTTARRGAGATADAAKETVDTARHEAPAAVQEAAGETTETTRKRTAGTRAAAKRTTTTAARRSRSTRSATKAAASSVGASGEAAGKAAEAAADKVGD